MTVNDAIQAIYENTPDERWEELDYYIDRIRDITNTPDPDTEEQQP